MTDPQPSSQTRVVHATHPAQTPATVALVASLVVCVPGSQVVSIVAGLIAVMRSRRLRLPVPPIALLGIILSIIQIAWGSAMLVGAYRTYQSALYAEPAVKATRQFLMFVGSGNLTNAKAMTTDAITLDQLTETAEQIEKWGGLKGDLSPGTGWSVEDMNRITITLPVEFMTANRMLHTQWQMIDGAPRLISYQFEDPNPSPATTQTK